MPVIAAAALPAAGALLTAAFGALAWVQPSMGSRGFMVVVALATAGYLLALAAVARRPELPVAVLVLCLLAGAAWRAPLVGASDGYSTDTIRYVWDSRVQRAGLSPYTTRPDDPAVADVHSQLTHHVDAPWLPTIYPPVAQWYFRVVTAFGESAAAFRVAAIVLDLAVALALWATLAAAGRARGWVLVYAWHPLLPLEAVLGGHLDMAGVLALTVSWLALVKRWPAVAALGFAAAVLIKPLPLVLAPLYWRRIGARHVWLGVLFAAVATLSLPGAALPVGSMPDFLDVFRFNGPVFALLASMAGPRPAAAAALVAGLSVAVASRMTLPREAAAGWAWPLAVALLFAPVIYPWYLLWLLPFLIGRAAIPVGVWTLSIAAVYPTWALASAGARWAVPNGLVAIEFALPVLAVFGLALIPLTQGWQRRVRSRACA